MPKEVFDAKAETSTGTPVPAGDDCRIPINGSAADFMSITKVNFLPCVQDGQEQVYISNGDQAAKVAAGRRLEEIQKQLSFRVCDGAPDDVLQFDQNRQTAVALNDALTVGEDQKVAVIRDQNVQVGQNQTVAVKNLRQIAATEISEFGDQKITIQTRGEIVIQGPGGSITINSQGVTIQGVLVKIN